MKNIVLILSFTVLALTVRGQSVVVDTFQGSPYELSFAYDVGNFAQSAEIAAPFIAQVSGNLATVDLGFTFYDHPYVGTASAYLYGSADDGNGNPYPDNANVVLLGYVLPNVQWQTTTTAIVSISVADTVPVTAGTTYWLVLKAGAPPHHNRCDTTTYCVYDQVPGDVSPCVPCVYDMWSVALPHVLNPAPGFVSFDDVNWINNQSPLPAFRITANTCTSDAWATKAPLLQAVTGAAGAVVDGLFYVIDGSTGATRPPPQAYDPVANSWSYKAPDPIIRANTSVGVINNKIYVAEGWINADSSRATQALEIYDPTTNSWTTAKQSTVARGGAACAVINGKLYVTGGSKNGGRVQPKDLEIYDPVRDKWSTGASLPTATGGQGTALNGKFYVIGGTLRGVNTGMLQIYEPATNRWTQGAPMPTPRGGVMPVAVNGKLYVIGGNNGTTLSTVEIYDPTSNTWTTGTSAPTARYGGTAGVIDSKIYATGGFNASSNIDGSLDVYTAVCP